MSAAAGGFGDTNAGAGIQSLYAENSRRSDDAGPRAGTPDNRRSPETRGIPRAARPLEALGTIPQRAGLGDGPRGLQPGRDRVGILPARSRALPRRTGGTKTAWQGSADRHQQICFALALWNGRDPILKERLFGLTGRRGQSRRGRQGVLLLPGQHADALVHAVSLQVPAGGVPLRAGWSKRTADAERTIRSSS